MKTAESRNKNPRMRRSQSLKTLTRPKTTNDKCTASATLLLADETNISADVTMNGHQVTLSPPPTAAKGKRPHTRQKKLTSQSGQRSLSPSRPATGMSVRFESDVFEVQSGEGDLLATEGNAVAMNTVTSAQSQDSGGVSPPRLETIDKKRRCLAASQKKPLVLSRLGGPLISASPEPRETHTKAGEELRVSDAPRTHSHAYTQNHTPKANVDIGEHVGVTMEHAASGGVSLLRILRRNEELLEQMEVLASDQRESQRRELEALEKLRAIKEAQKAERKRHEEDKHRATQSNREETGRLKNELTQKSNEIRRLRNDLERANSAMVRTTQPAFPRSQSQSQCTGATGGSSNYLDQRRESRQARRSALTENHRGGQQHHGPLHHHDMGYPYLMGDSHATRYVRVDTTRLPLAAISRTAFRTSEDWAQCLVNNGSSQRKSNRR